MYYQTAMTAVNFLNGQHSDPGKATSEVDYYTACVAAERRERSRAAHQALRARFARLIARLTLGKPAHSPVQTATLRGSDPHILDDLGIANTPFGGQVLVTQQGQSDDLLAPLPAVTAAPIRKPVAMAEGKAASPFGNLTAIPAT